MRTNYIIYREVEGTTEKVFTASTKREIEMVFNRYMKRISKDSDYIVENIRFGYSRVTFCGTFARVIEEYWIARA